MLLIGRDNRAHIAVRPDEHPAAGGPCVRVTKAVVAAEQIASGTEGVNAQSRSRRYAMAIHFASQQGSSAVR